MNKLSPREKFVGLSAVALTAIGGGVLAVSAADCNPNLGDVCTPGLTVPPDVDPVPGNPKPGETIPVSPTMPEKGTTSTSSTTTTIEESTTTSSTVPGSTSSTSTTVTSAPTSLPPITIVVPPTVPAHSN